VFIATVSPKCFGQDSVLKKLKGLHSDKSSGPDSMHTMLLTECADELAGPVSTIFVQSYQSGNLPQDWKFANVVPIYKKGKRVTSASIGWCLLPVCRAR